MSYAKLSRRPLLFKSFTGLYISEFDVISKEIESRYEEHERKRLSNRKRKRDVGAAGRPTIQTETQRKILLDAVDVLFQTVHYLYIIRISF
jgi:hypothetical protein